MASIIVPADTQATFNDHHGDASAPHADHSGHAHNANSHGATSHSTPSHDGLTEIGTIESSCYLVRIYAGDTQPLYTVIDLTDGSTLGSLLTADEVDSSFPDLQITESSFDTIGSSSRPHVIMHAGDDSQDFN